MPWDWNKVQSHNQTVAAKKAAEAKRQEWYAKQNPDLIGFQSPELEKRLLRIEWAIQALITRLKSDNPIDMQMAIENLAKFDAYVDSKAAYVIERQIMESEYEAEIVAADHLVADPE